MSSLKMQNRNKDILSAELEKATGTACTWTQDPYGNAMGWLHLTGPDKLLPAVKLLAEQKARLATITAYAEERGDQDKKRGIAYHFVLCSILFTVSIPIYNPESFEKLPVPSITPWFRNADWNEREFKEMFNIDIIDHPNPKRLFLDERLDAGIMTRLIPFSTMLHGAGSRDLWEKVMEEKAGHKPSFSPADGKDQKNEKIEEPQFTPVEQPAANCGEADKD